MKFSKIAAVLMLLPLTVFAQKNNTGPVAAIDSKALLLPDSLTNTTDRMASYINLNFTTETDKARAIFIWIASNIQYDVENMFAINFYEKKSEKIAKPLRTRTGICENYASLFTDICLKTGIKSVVVEGYTKQSGFVDYIPHAWSAARIDSVWFLYDPTWGSGYISGDKFIRKINNYYCKTQPSSLIRSHMPFDYLWQFLNYPITNQQFYEGKTTADITKRAFTFNDSIRVYERLSTADQWRASARRVEQNGVKNSLVYDRLQHLKLQIENDRQNKIVSLYNAAVASFNDGVNDLNKFINYRNKQFQPLQSDASIQEMLDIVGRKLASANNMIGQIQNPDENVVNMIAQIRQSIGDAQTHLEEQQNWLRVYFSKNKSGRKAMFYERKVTIFGKPVN